MEFELNQTYEGFTLKEQREVKDINSMCRLFEHKETKARLLYVSNDDENKVFSIAFRTPPYDDTGVPHILEHSVLCGSRKFPLKEPFVELLKSSQNTFLNALTYTDKTLYPVASMNNKDLLNLMDVYLDAVFYPNLYDKKEIFMQEGWHYELNDRNDELTYKGVVYNEMKGYYSQPEVILSKNNLSSLLPNTPYSYDSGGDPDSIPNLTYEKFVEFHSKYYHPSNSYIYLYGNGDIIEHLKFINDNYLKDFEFKNIDSKIEGHKEKVENKQIEINYPIGNDENLKNKYYLSYNYCLGSDTNREISFAISILVDVLMGSNAAPLKKALVESNIAADYTMDYLGEEILEKVAFITAHEADYKKKNLFIKTINDTFRKIINDGFDLELIEGVINKEEFRIRESNTGKTPKGLVYNQEALKLWLYDENPIDALEYEKYFDIIKQNYKNRYFESLLEKYFMNNNFTSFVVLKPEKGLALKRVKEKKKNLKEIKEKLDDKEIEAIIKQTKKLLELQSQKDSPESLDKIPKLKVEDIKKETSWVDFSRKKIADVDTLFFSHATNGIVYTTFKFNTHGVPQELIQYITLLASMLGEMATNKTSYEDLAKKMDINIGNFFAYIRNVSKIDSDEYIPELIIEVKGLKEKTKEILEITREIIQDTIFDDEKKLKENLIMMKSKLKSAVLSGGTGVVLEKIASELSKSGRYNEKISKLETYKFVARLEKDFDNMKNEIKNNLQKVKDIIFNKKNLSMLIVCEEEDCKTVEEEATKLINSLKNSEVRKETYKFDEKIENIAYTFQGNVQYVGKGFNFKNLGYRYNGHMYILGRILYLDYLWNEVRVKGGAYGSAAFIREKGEFITVSWSDPNLKETLAAYNNIGKYLKNCSLNKNEFENYIISSIGEMDVPHSTPYQKAYSVESKIMAGGSKEYEQKIRNEVLESRPEQIIEYAKMIDEIMEKGIVCVMGSEQKIKQSAELFDVLEKVE